MKNAFIMEDLSCLSSISMNVASPIVASYGLRSLAMPVQTLITQTEMENQVNANYSYRWLAQNLQTAHHIFADSESVGLIGYLGKNEIVELIAKSELINDISLLVVDPAMADEGKFYPLLDENYCAKVSQLLQTADIVTPNLTELAFLTTSPVPDHFNENQVISMVAKLRQTMKEDSAIVVTGLESDGQIGCYWDDNVSCGTSFLNKVDGHFYGTGDAFAAALLGEMTQGARLVDCLPRIMKQIQLGVKNTLLAQNDLKLGIDIMPLIKHSDN